MMDTVSRLCRRFMFDDILAVMKSIVIVFSLVFSSLWVSSPALAAEQVVMQLGAEFWAVPRHGEALLERPPLQAAVQQLLAQPEAYLRLHHPATESGELWGQELQAWLVSLGVVSSRIELRSGFEGDDGVAVILVTPAAAEPVMDESQGEEQSVEEMGGAGAVDAAPAPLQGEMEPQ